MLELLKLLPDSVVCFALLCLALVVFELLSFLYLGVRFIRTFMYLLRALLI
jgi:hypothetical protein